MKKVCCFCSNPLMTDKEKNDGYCNKCYAKIVKRWYFEKNE